MKTRKRASILVLALLGAMILLSPGSSSAIGTSGSASGTGQPLGSVLPQTSSAMPLFQLSAHDLSFRLLYIVFGPVIASVQNGTFFTLSSTASGTLSSFLGAAAGGGMGATTMAIDGSSGAGTVMGSFFEIYNLSMIFFASLIIIWKLVTHILLTADRGEWVGKNISTFWAPLRVVTSLSFLVPISNGYSLVQGVVFWIVLQGCAVADTATSAVMNAFSNNLSPVPISMPQGEKVAASLLKDLTCAIDMNNRIGPQYFSSYPDGGANPVVIQTTSYGFNRSGNSNAGSETVTVKTFSGTTLSSKTLTSVDGGSGGYAEVAFVENPTYAFDDPDEINTPICGSIRIQVPYQPMSSGNTSFLSLGGTLTSLPIYNSLYSAMGTAQFNGINNALSAIIPLAVQIGTGQVNVSSASGLATLNSSIGPVTGNANISNAVTSSHGGATGASTAPNYNAYTSAISTYDQSLITGMQNASSSLSSTGVQTNIQDALSSKGWIQLGAVWLSLEKMNEEGENLLKDHVTTSDPSVNLTEYPNVGKKMKEAVALANTANGSFERNLQSSGSLTSAATSTSTSMASVSRPGANNSAPTSHSLLDIPGNIEARLLTIPVAIIMKAMGYNVSIMGQLTAGGLMGNGTDNLVNSVSQNTMQGNPMVNFIVGGQRIMNLLGVILSIIGPLALLAKGGGAAGKALGIFPNIAFPEFSFAIPAGFLMALLKYAMWYLLIILGIMALLGFLLGIMLPTIPILAWTGGIAGWMLMVAETLVAAPLWALMHSNPEGEGWSPDSARIGYQMLASLSLRPALMVAGMFFGMSMMVGMAWILGMLMPDYMRTLNENSGLGGAIMSVLSSIIIVGTIVYFAHMSMKLVRIIPDSVLRYIGGGQDSLGAADEMKGHAQQIFGAVNFGGVASRAAQSVTTQSMMGKVKEIADRMSGGEGKGKKDSRGSVPPSIPTGDFGPSSGGDGPSTGKSGAKYAKSAPEPASGGGSSVPPSGEVPEPESGGKNPDSSTGEGGAHSAPPGKS